MKPLTLSFIYAILITNYFDDRHVYGSYLHIFQNRLLIVFFNLISVCFYISKERVMDLAEYEKVKEFSYLEYCDYLQQKHGIGLSDYMTKSWNKNSKVTRTKDGLIAHHKFEDHAIMLSTKEFAMHNPFEWQLAKNIVYCDYLEHLFLHILICEHPSCKKNELEAVGIGGVINFIVPELNDLYSGWKTEQLWRRNCHNLVIDDQDVYLVLLKRFKTNCSDYPFYTENCLYTSFNEAYGLWSREKNNKIFQQIAAL